MRGLFRLHTVEPLALVGAFVAKFSVQDWTSVVIMFASVGALLPLAIWRWRALLSKNPVKAEQHEPPAPPCE